MKRFLGLILASILLANVQVPPAFSQAGPPGEVEKFLSNLQTLLKEYYPEAVFQKTEKHFACRFRTKTFMIHHPLKTGEWQDARPQEGPDRGGILCTVSWEKGPWAGAAVVPQTFDDKYFASSLDAPYIKSRDLHLEARLSYPQGTKPQFLNRYSQLLCRIEESGKTGEPRKGRK